MAKFAIIPCKTYASEENVDKAVKDKGFEKYRYFIIRTKDGRFYPVFVGTLAVEVGIHFHFNVVA